MPTMNEGATGLLVFLVIAIASSLLWHYFVPVFGLAVTAATLTTVAAFQCAAYLQLGYLDPFWMNAVITSSGLGLALSILIGLPFRKRRRAAKPR